ncbi:MAG: pyridoxal-dependent decarboxylase [Planctomycetota bacterium]|nr:pyridoxal-dependent decarboxylase [Planctomycetota bacterium]
MTESPQPGDLSFSPERMREIGYSFVDAIVEQFEQVRDQPAVCRRSRAEMEALFREPVPETPRDVNDVLSRVVNDVFANSAPLDHPRFFAFVPSPHNFISVMAESLMAARNVFMGSWMVSPGPSTVELVTIDWLRDLCGLPETAGGLFVSGGSMANLCALATARKVKLDDDMTDAIAYGSVQAHSSLDRALRVLGFKEDQWKHVETDDHLRLDINALRTMIEADLNAGLKPFCIVASAGTTNTGAVDPLNEIADLCVELDLWMHVDGAYGAPAILTKEGKEALRGLDRADSLSMDPHKWLFQPYEMGCVLVRERSHLLDTFHVFKDYMQDVVGEEEEINFRDYGVQLTRNFKALKLWMSLQVFGLDAFREAVDHGIQLARFTQHYLESEAKRDRWEVVSQASLGIICFRYLPPGIEDEQAIDAFNLALIDAMYDSGYAMVSSTLIDDRPVLRFCAINPRTTEDDIRSTIEKFEEMAIDT